MKSISKTLSKIRLNKKILKYLSIVSVIIISLFFLYFLVIEINPRLHIQAYYKSASVEQLYPFGESARKPTKDIDLNFKFRNFRIFRVIYEIKKENLSENLKGSGVSNNLVVVDEFILVQKNVLNWDFVSYSNQFAEVANNQERDKVINDFKKRESLDTYTPEERKKLEEETKDISVNAELQEQAETLDQSEVNIEENFDIRKNSNGGEDMYGKNGRLLLENVIEIGMAEGYIVAVGSDKPEGYSGNLGQQHTIYKIDPVSGNKVVLFYRSGEGPTFVAKGDKVIYAMSNEIGIIDIETLEKSITLTFQDPELPGDSYYHPNLIYTTGANAVIVEIQRTDYLTSRLVDLWSIGFDGSKENLGVKKIN